jgi:hypothetical protein
MIVADARGKRPNLTFAAAAPSGMSRGPNNDEKDISPIVDILNLALPYFGLIFIGFACGKAKGLPGVDELLPALCFAAESCPRRRLRNSIIRHSSEMCP